LCLRSPQMDSSLKIFFLPASWQSASLLSRVLLLFFQIENNPRPSGPKISPLHTVSFFGGFFLAFPGAQGSSIFAMIPLPSPNWFSRPAQLALVFLSIDGHLFTCRSIRFLSREISFFGRQSDYILIEDAGSFPERSAVICRRPPTLNNAVFVRLSTRPDLTCLFINSCQSRLRHPPSLPLYIGHDFLSNFGIRRRGAIPYSFPSAQTEKSFSPSRYGGDFFLSSFPADRSSPSYGETLASPPSISFHKSSPMTIVFLSYVHSSRHSIF